MVHDAHAAILATMDLLGEAARSSGSATAGAHITQDALEDVGPASRAARTAAALAGLAEADRLLVTADVIGALQARRRLDAVVRHGLARRRGRGTAQHLRGAAALSARFSC